MNLPLLPFVATAVATGALACTKQYIPNTDVEDNDDNRKVVAFCERYRRAVEERNATALLAMASPRYFEDGANADAADDMDYAGLREYLQGQFQRTRAIRYEIRYRRVARGRGRVMVEYTYAASYRVPALRCEREARTAAEAKRTGADPPRASPDGCEEWRHAVSDNRLELVEDGDGFKIVAGM